MVDETPRKVKAKLVDDKNQTFEKRRVTDFLPAINQSDLIKKFFAGTADSLFQPEQSESLAGFIGRIPPHALLDREFYIEEPTREREEYQLEPTPISTDPETGDVENILFYEDLANLLRFQGGIINNHDRLYESEVYTWAPPIDLDKFMNYTNYFWFEGGPDVFRFTELTNIGALIGTSDPISIQGVDFEDDMLVVFENDLDIVYRDRVFIVSGIGSSFALTVYSSLDSFVWDDIIGWDNSPWDGPDPQLAVGLDPDYIVMERGARDGNAWSTGNRWYHRDDLNATQLEIALERQALRPIIEFKKDLELYNHGTYGRAPVTVRDDVTTDPEVQIVGSLIPVTIDGIEIQNGDTILFTQGPALEGIWDETGWDFEDPTSVTPLDPGHPSFGDPEGGGFDQTTTGSWDPFFNVTYSAPATDLILTGVPPAPGVITTLAGNFLAQGFTAGMKIQLSGSTDQDGVYTIATVSATIITLEEAFTGSTGLGVPQPNNVTIVQVKQRFRNRIFRVGGIGDPDGITLTLVTDGQNPDGSPADGDQVKVLLGLVHQDKTYYWSDSEDEWVLSQEKLTINQAPLFQLYDTEATQLQDPGKYPLSNFAGSKIFGYQINTDPRQPLDDELGIPLVFNSFGEITFENFMVTERYQFNNPAEEIIGYHFHRTIGETTNDDFYGNDWYLKSRDSSCGCRQFLINQYTADGITDTFELSLEPENNDDVQVFINGIERTPADWTINGVEITFPEIFDEGDIVRVRYYSPENLPDDATAIYEIPINLEANPDNEEITFIANADYFTHFTGIIANQEDFIGNPNGLNNYRNTVQDRSIGTEILQHRAPMLKVMALGSNQNIDYMRSIRYVEREYSRFRNKFLKKINEFFNDGIHTTTQAPSEWIEDALEAINLGRINEFPFAFSGMGTRLNGEPTYIPASPSRLGVYPVFTPGIYEDTTYTTPRNVIQFHDGSLVVAFNDFRDDVILELENNIYATIPDEYKTDERQDFDWTDYVEAQFRTGDYSIEEFNKLLTPIIERWAVTQSIDLQKNNSFDITNPFTWNYSKQGLPGYWRGIFKLYYDTDRPNTHPWEMLGFSEEPDWWLARYGPAPYKSTNVSLWNDIRNGAIAFGSRAGINPKYARPDVPIPVDPNGNILDPVTLGLAEEPGLIDKQADWKIGDHGPAETVFRRSEYWPYAIAQISYLMKPAKFIELGWDPRLQLYRYENQEHPQWIDTSTEDRKQHSEYTVHGETLSDGTIYESDGIQQWITDYLVHNGMNVTTNFGDVIRTLEVRLGHRMAGFINPNTTRVIADNFGLVPDEDVTLSLYTNPSIREEVYSGVIIERVELGWAVYGYDALNPFFNILPSIKNSNQRTVIEVASLRVIEYKRFEEDSVSIPYGTVFKTQQEVYDFLISYGKYLESKGWVFDEVNFDINETNNWRLSGKQFLFWSLGRWEIGSIIAVSPASQNIKFKTDQGMIESLEQVINGIYGLLDKDGAVIPPSETFVSRFEGELTVTPEETRSIYAARLYITETEHVLLFNNTTIFNDLIYDPLYRLRQARFKMFVARGLDWRGRVDAPGFIVTETGLLPNYEKTANDFRRYFEIEDRVVRPALIESARRLFGFETRDYLENLLFSDDTQFQFYQGFIRQKGTRLVLDKLLRSDIASFSDSVQFFEEWALRLGEYGSIQDAVTAEVLLRQEEFRANPQLVAFKGSTLEQAIDDTETAQIVVSDGTTFPQSGILRIGAEQIFYTAKSGDILSGLTRGVNETTPVTHNVGALVGIVDTPYDDILTISVDDERWVARPPDDGLIRFPARNLSAAKRNKNAAYFFRTDTAVAGYPLETEVTFHVNTIEERNAIFDEQRITVEAEDLQFGDTIWVSNIGNYYESINPNSIFNFGFMVYRFTDLGIDFEIPKLPINVADRTLILTSSSHGLVQDQIVMITDDADTIPDLNGTYNTQLVTTVLGSGFASPTANESFILNGTTVTISGITVTEVIDSIDSAAPAGIIAYEESGEIRIVNVDGDSIILSEGPTVIGTQNAVFTTGDDITINGENVVLSTGIATATGAPGATYTAGEGIIVDGTPVILTAPYILGTTGPIYTPGQSIIINGIEVTFFTGSGTDAQDAADDINSESIIGITASVELGALKITGDVDFTLEEGTGTALNDLFPQTGGNPTTITHTAQAVEDINNEAIPGITATLNLGAIEITSSSSFTLAEGPSGTALDDLGLSHGLIAVESTLEDAAQDINDANIENITASVELNALRLDDATGEGISLAEGSGTALADLGLAVLSDIGLMSGTYTTPSGNMFSVGETITTDENTGIHPGRIGIFTESRFTNKDARNNAVINSALPTTIPWTTGEYVYVDDREGSNDDVPLWTVYQYSGTSPATTTPTLDGDWTVAVSDNVNRVQTPRVDTELFKQTLLYNRMTNIIDSRLNIWDPAKGLFPGQSTNDIDFKLEIDPAKYTHGDEELFQIDPLLAWSEEQVGTVWWDLSQAEYVNYETGSNRERRNKWGRLAPGKSVDVYEWVRSTVPPAQWADLVEQSADEPEESFDYKPSGEAYKADETDNAPYVQRIVRNQTTGVEETIYYFWVRNSETIPNVIDRDYSVAQIARHMTNPTASGIPWWAPISESSLVFSGVEFLLTRDNSVLQLNYNFTKNQNNLHREWVLSREGDSSDIPTDRFWNKMRDSLVGFDVNDNPVPAPELEESRKLGNFIRPRQTWFADREQAGRIFLGLLNEQMAATCVVDERPDLFNSLFDTTVDPEEYTGTLPHPFGANRPVNQYDYHVTNETERDLLLTTPGLNDYDQVWVDGTVETGGFWKVYQHVSGEFNEVHSEAYRLEDFWEQIDYFADGFSSSDVPDFVVDTLAERNALEPSITEGMVVRVNDSNSDGNNVWAWFQYNPMDAFTPWVLVAKNDCSLEFDIDLFYDETYGNNDSTTISSYFPEGLAGKDQALKTLIDALRNEISTDLEENLLFYAMINYVHSEQPVVDWAFKTTYLFALGFNQAATQDPILRPDPTQSFIDFINEIKPYHTKLRDFVTNQNLGLDVYETNVTDFDKPVYFDEELEEFRVLDPAVADDRAIMATQGSDQYYWFANYVNNSELVRSFTTTLLFDRVSCDLTGGWDPLFGWDSGPNEDWDLSISMGSITAAERIILDYSPQPKSNEAIEEGNIDPIIDLQTLISGCDYRGTIVDAKNFNITDIEIDTELQGGEISNTLLAAYTVNYGNHSGPVLPVAVATYAGDGSTDTFAIGATPEASGSVLVLVDNVLQTEGVHYNIVGSDVVFVPTSIPLAGDGIHITLAEFTLPAGLSSNYVVTINFGAGRVRQDESVEYYISGGRFVFFTPPQVSPLGSDFVEVFDNIVRVFAVPSGATFPVTVTVDGVLQTEGVGNDYTEITTAFSNLFVVFQDDSIPEHGAIVSIADEATMLEAPTEAADVIVDGNLFNQPNFEAGHPEELVLNTIGEALSICVTAEQQIGAPKIVTTRFIGLGAGPYPLNQSPASKDAIFVYVNGIKQDFDDFTFDNSNNTISFVSATPGTADLVVITSFAIGGAEEIVATEEITGNGIDNTFPLSTTLASEGSVFVTLNGIVQQQGIGLDYTVSVPLNEITFSSTPAGGDNIEVTIFASDEYTTIKSTKAIVSGPLAAPASNIYEIGQEIDSRDPARDPNRIAEADNLFVSRNGVRQKSYSESVFAGWSDLGGGAPWSASSWSGSNVDFDYRVRYNDGPGVPDDIIFAVKIFTDANPTYNTGDSFYVEGIEVTLTGTGVLDAIHDINNAMVANSNTEIIAIRDKTNEAIQIMNIEGNAITIDAGTGSAITDLGFSGPFPRTIESSLTVGDIIYISSINNDYTVFRTEYDGTNSFELLQDLVITEQVDLFINGILIEQNPGPVNYTVDLSTNMVEFEPILVSGLTVGDSIEIISYYTSTDTFTGDSTGSQAEYVLSQAVVDTQKVFVNVNGVRQFFGIDYNIIGGNIVRFNIPHFDTDDIVITSLTGTESAPPIAFRQFLSNQAAKDAAKTIAPFALTALSDDISAIDTTIPVDDSASFPSTGILIIGTDVGNTIDYEFIRYNGFDVDDNPLVVERGANSTTAAAHSTGDLVLILNPDVPEVADINAYRISDDGKAQLTQPLALTDTEIHLDQVAGLPKQKPGELRLKKPGVIWIGYERIEFYEREGTVLKQIVRGTKGTSAGIPAVYDSMGDLVSDAYTGGELTYPVGTVVIDGSTKQEIPGGYRWEAAPFGLQFSESTLAKFLKAKPGTC